MNKVPAKVASEILSVIDRSDKVLLHLHPSPDADSIGSALAVSNWLKQVGKKVTLIKGDSDLPREFGVLPGFEMISEENFSEVDQSGYDLFLILDSSSLDRVTNLNPVVFHGHLKTVVIDHHADNLGFGDINLINEKASATAEIIYELFDIWRVPITKEVAICLLVGLYGDTGSFQFPNTTARTFSIASALVEKYPDFSEVLEALRSNRHPDWVAYQGLAFSNLLMYQKMAVSVVPYQEIERRGFTRETIGEQNVANTLILVRDWLVGVSVSEKEPGVSRVSLRSRKPEVYDVSKIAQVFGGGGHKAASGAQIMSSAQDAGNELMQAIAGIYPDLLEEI